MAHKEYLTKKRYEEIKLELEHLENVKRSEVSEQLEYAKSLGDLSENAEYQEARENQAKLEERISHMKSVLQSAVFITSPGGQTIDVGSTVSVLKEKEGNPKTYKIVGSEEANMAEMKISDQSPLGAALIGKKGGDKIEVITPSGVKILYTIV